MQEGRCNALVSVLNRLSESVDASACLVADERGLLISEYLQTNIDKNAMATFASLLSGTSNRFINPLELKKLNSLIINAINSIILIKEIPINQLNRKFTLCIMIEKDKIKNRKLKKKPRGLRNYIRNLLGLSSFKNHNGFNAELLKNADQTVIEIQRIFNT
ncbi:MAG: roadblock/LC7 domain-containing protein [Candidatus Odinarchaeia archaeon]